MSEPRDPAPPEEIPREESPVRRRPGRVRRWVVRPFVWGMLILVVLLATGLLLLQSRFARQQALARMVTQASKFLGNRQVKIGNIDYNFFPPSVELRDIAVPGPGPNDPPVLRAPFASLQLSVRDLRGRVFDIDQIVVERPEVYLQVNADGSTNMPQLNFGGGGGGPKKLDIRVGHILVQDGTLRINELRSPFSLDAKAVWGRLVGRAERNNEGGTRLDAQVTAQEISTTLPHALPYRFTVSARGSIVPAEGQVRITTARIAGPDLIAKADGTILYRAENRHVELHYTADGATQILNRLGYMTDPIAGPFSVQGRFDWQQDGWSYGGTASTPRVATLGRVFQDASLAFTGRREGIDVKVDRARYAGGTVSGLVNVEYAKQTRDGIPVALDLDYTGLDIQKLIADQFPGEELPIVSGLAGQARGTLKYQFGHQAVVTGTGRADVHVQGAHVQGSNGAGLPIAGDLPITLDRGVVASRDLHLTSPGQDITSHGFSFDIPRGTGQLDFRLVSQDVAPLAPLLRGKPVAGEPPPFWLPAQGKGTAEGTVTFARNDYALRLLLDLRDVVAPVTNADSVHGSLSLNPRAVEDMRLELARDGGALMVTGRVPLAPPGRTAATEPIALAVDAVQWPASGLGYFLSSELAGVFQGQLSGRLDLSGPPDKPSGRVDAQVQNLEVQGVALGRARAVASFDGNGRFQVQEGQVEMPAGLAVVRGSYDLTTEAFDFTLTAPGLSLAAAPFRAPLGGELTGLVSVDAAASGTLDQPRGMVSIRGRDLALGGRAVIQPGEARQGDTQVVATWDGQRVDVQGSLLGMASFQGGGRLDRQGTDLAIDVHTDQLGTLARAFSPQPLPELNGSLVGTVAVGADFNAKTFQTAVRLSDLRLQYQGHTIASREPVVAEVNGDRVTLRSFYLAEPGTENELFVSGSVGLQRDVPLDLRFQSTLAATWAELLIPGAKVQKGSLDLLGSLRGTPGDPRLNGEGVLHDGQIILPNVAQAFEDVNAYLSFNRDSIVLDDLRARLGSGTLQSSGSLTLPGPGRELAYVFTVSARDVSYRFPDFLLNRGDAVVTVRSNGEGREIQGDVTLRRSLYVEDITVDPLLLLQQALLQRQRLQVAETDDLLSTTQLALTVRGPDALRVRNNLANLQGDVQLTVRGSLARPVVFGDVDLDPGGTLVFNDNQYEVLRGQLTFGSTTKIDPVIDLVAQTEIQGFNITLNVNGTIGRPDLHFSSDSNLADLEIVSLVATGQRPSPEAGYAPPPTDQDVAPTEVARQFLYGQAASVLTKRVGTLFGFDRFRIDPLTSAGQPISGVGFTVGKRLSRDVFVTYSYDPTNNRQSIVQVEWQLRKNVTLVLTQVGDGTYTIDAQVERRF